MDRITARMDDGTAFVCSETGSEGVGHFTTQRRLPELIARLAAYEDTGLTPEEIQTLQSENAQLRAKLDKAVEDIPAKRGKWIYTIKKGSCYDYHVTAKCSECGWDWFSADGVGNYSAVFGAFITNGASRPEETTMFLLENAKAINKMNFCPNCGADMRGDNT